MFITSLAFVCPMKPDPSGKASPSGVRPRPLICEWGATRDERAVEAAEGGGIALCATGVEVEGIAVVFILIA